MVFLLLWDPAQQQTLNKALVVTVGVYPVGYIHPVGVYPVGYTLYTYRTFPHNQILRGFRKYFPSPPGCVS